MHSWAKRIGLRKPQNKIEWALWVGAIFLAIAIVVWFVFVRRNPQELESQPLLAAYTVYILKNIGFAIVVAALLISGIQLLRAGKNKTKGYVVTIGAFLMFMIFIARPMLSMFLLTYIQDIRLSKEILEIRQQELKSEMSPRSRVLINQWIAEGRYCQDGVLIDYIDESGNKVAFQPSKEDIQIRKRHLMMPRILRFMKIESSCWTILFIGSAIAGFTGYRRSTKK